LKISIPSPTSEDDDAPARENDIDVNIAKEKKLTNMRSSTSEQTVSLRPA